MKTESLNVIAKVIAGQSPPSETYNNNGDGLPFFQGKTDFQTKFPKVRVWCSSKNSKEAFPGDILMSVRAPVGPVNVCNQHAIIGRGISAIRPFEGTYSDYLYYFLKSNEEMIASLGTGSTFKAITQQTLAKIQIPFPEFDDQIRIATLLSRVEALIATRKDNLRLLDEFLKSMFLDMFGDPVRNEKEWEVIPMPKIGKFISGGTPSKEREDYWCGNFPWVSPKDMKCSYIADSQDHISETVFKETSLKIIQPQNLLIVVRGMILAHSFPLAINSVSVAINQDMKAIQPSQNINVRYLMACLDGMKRQVLVLISSAGHGTKKFDSLAMNKVMVPVPPLPMQEKFAAIVEKAESLRNHYQQNLTELENLYGALSQKAFKGELDLSRIPLHHKTLAEFENNQDEAATTAESVVPENINTTLANLNEFNQSIISLKAIESAARISSFNPAQFDLVKQAAAQIAAFHSPLEQLKNMSSIASAMAQIESVIKPLNLTQFDSISSSVELARNMAYAVPKIDMSWLEQHNDALKYATAHFDSMCSTIARIESLNYDRIDSIAKRMESAAIPKFNAGLSDQYRETLRKMSDPVEEIRNAVERASTSSIYTQHLDAANRLQSTIPDFTSLQRLTSNPLGMYLDNEAVYTKLQFHHEDVIDILDNAGEPLSFESLMQQLGELETVDFSGYETIKAILFDLLAGNLVTQVFDEKQKLLRFTLVENGWEE